MRRRIGLPTYRVDAKAVPLSPHLGAGATGFDVGVGECVHERYAAVAALPRILDRCIPLPVVTDADLEDIGGGVVVDMQVHRGGRHFGCVRIGVLGCVGQRFVYRLEHVMPTLEIEREVARQPLLK